MKKICKFAMLLGLVLIVFMFSACGSGGDADESYVGKWISVAGEAMGVTLTGDDISGFALDLQSGGKAVLTVDGESENVKWKNEENTIIITAEGTDITGTVENDTIVFENMLDMGLKLTFAKEGSDAASPERYLSETDKNMIGIWQSTAVTDILGDSVDTYKADALKLEFAADHTVDIYLNGKADKGKKWSTLGDDWGSIDDENIDLNWDVTEDGIDVNYSLDGEDYIFSCKKQ